MLFTFQTASAALKKTLITDQYFRRASEQSFVVPVPWRVIGLPREG